MARRPNVLGVCRRCRIVSTNKMLGTAPNRSDAGNIYFASPSRLLVIRGPSAIALVPFYKAVAAL